MQDIAGLVKGASKGEGLGNQFLANIRECDSIVQVGGWVRGWVHGCVLSSGGGGGDDGGGDSTGEHC